MRKMSISSHILLAGISCFFFFQGSMASMAASDGNGTPIQQISITVESDIADGGDGGVSLSTNSSNYYADSYEWADGKEEWAPGDSPKVRIYIQAEDGYYFNKISSQAKVNVNGAKFVSIKATGNTSLVLTVRLDPVSGELNSPNKAVWSDNDNEQLGRGTWDKVDNAGYYEVRLYRDDQQIFSSSQVTGNSYNFYSQMTKTGTYRFQVRALPREGAEKYMEKSPWSISDEMDVHEDYINHQKKYGTADPGISADAPLQPIWKNDQNGWWYRRSNGSYPVDSWEYIDNKWYLFDKAGYMKTGWQDRDGKSYYLDSKGALAVNTVVDGRYVGGDGAVLPPGWIQDEKGWWYRKSDGSYPSDTWNMIKQKWYLFDKNGYMLTGWQNKDSQWYYLETDGAMASNTTVGGFYVDAQGVWHP